MRAKVQRWLLEEDNLIRRWLLRNLPMKQTLNGIRKGLEKDKRFRTNEAIYSRMVYMRLHLTASQK